MIEDFYRDKSILITGSTGFLGISIMCLLTYLLGKVLLEKVMRSLPSIKTVYLGINARVSLVNLTHIF